MSATQVAAQAAAPVDRAAVWNYLRGEHAEVAARLRAEESRIAGCRKGRGSSCGRCCSGGSRDWLTC
jgi:hypothetical protein